MASTACGSVRCETAMKTDLLLSTITLPPSKA